MAAAAPFNGARIHIKNAVPQREEHVIVLRHWIQIIQAFQHRGRIAHIAARNSTTLNSVHRAHAKQRGTNSMSAHIKQINGQARLIKPVVAERVATQTFAGNKFPFCSCRAIGQNARLLLKLSKFESR